MEINNTYSLEVIFIHFVTFKDHLTPTTSKFRWTIYQIENIEDVIITPPL